MKITNETIGADKRPQRPEDKTKTCLSLMRILECPPFPGGIAIKQINQEGIDWCVSLYIAMHPDIPECLEPTKLHFPRDSKSFGVSWLICPPHGRGPSVRVLSLFTSTVDVDEEGSS